MFVLGKQTQVSKQFQLSNHLGKLQLHLQDQDLGCTVSLTYAVRDVSSLFSKGKISLLKFVINLIILLSFKIEIDFKNNLCHCATVFIFSRQKIHPGYFSTKKLHYVIGFLKRALPKYVSITQIWEDNCNISRVHQAIQSSTSISL